MLKKIFTAFLFCFSIASTDAFTSEYLTGDWNGSRKKAHDAGVDFLLLYSNDIAGNPWGGKSQGWTGAGRLDAALSFDAQKISNISGLKLFSSFSWVSGNSLSSHYIDNQFPVQQLYSKETYKLVELYLSESLCNQNLNIKLGRLCAGNDFLNSPVFLQYVTGAINSNPVAIIDNAFLSSYPLSTWGAYLDFRLSSFLFKFGAYNNNIDTWANKYHGVNFTLDHKQGITFITEWTFLYNQEGRYALKGNYKIGGYYITEQSACSSHDGMPSNFGVYFLFDQMLKQWINLSKIAENLTAWGAFLYSPPDRNPFPFFCAGGLVGQGIIASRPYDTLCFGVAYGHYSSSIDNRALLTINHGIIYPHHSQSAETQLELNYCIQATRYLALTPVVQYVINPKGFGTTPNALVLGIQIEIEL